MNGYLEEGKKIVWSRLVLLEEDTHSCVIINIAEVEFVNAVTAGGSVKFLPAV